MQIASSPSVVIAKHSHVPLCGLTPCDFVSMLFPSKKEDYLMWWLRDKLYAWGHLCDGHEHLCATHLCEVDL